MPWKENIPEGWVWNGMRWKGVQEFPVYIFKNKSTGLSKGFSGWEVQPPTKDRAVEVLKEYLGIKV
jgi:hypothetical protein